MVTQISEFSKALIQAKLIDHDKAETLEKSARLANLELADYIYHHTSFTPDDVAHACSTYFDIALVKLADIQKPIMKNNVIYFNENTEAAIYRPFDLAHIDAQIPIHWLAADDYFTLRSQSQQATIACDDTTAAALLNTIIIQAIEQQASDIHIEPFEKQVTLRFRVHGLLQPAHQLTHLEHQQICLRLKVLSDIDFTQTRLPQDGRFSYHYDTQPFDCRLSFCPTIYGEKISIRLLNIYQHTFQLSELGLTQAQMDLLTTQLGIQQGLLLVTGPTGSGKTQTLYTLLNYLNRSSHNISTIEDPVEIKLPFINQINVDNDVGLDFARVLRALLRQDPDIIMIGEIRDEETADLAIRAAQTGHLVLATLHTQSAIETINRLQQLGISRFNIASTLKLVIAQRLVRIKEKRSGIFELLRISAMVQNHIINQSDNASLQKAAMADGFKDLWHQGMQLVINQDLSINELKRVGLTPSEKLHEVE